MCLGAGGRRRCRGACNGKRHVCDGERSLAILRRRRFRVYSYPSRPAFRRGFLSRPAGASGESSVGNFGQPASAGLGCRPASDRAKAKGPQLQVASAISQFATPTNPQSCQMASHWPLAVASRYFTKAKGLALAATPPPRAAPPAPHPPPPSSAAAGGGAHRSPASAARRSTCTRCSGPARRSRSASLAPLAST